MGVHIIVIGAPWERTLIDNRYTMKIERLLPTTPEAEPQFVWHDEVQ